MRTIREKSSREMWFKLFEKVSLHLIEIFLCISFGSMSTLSSFVNKAILRLAAGFP